MSTTRTWVPSLALALALAACGDRPADDAAAPPAAEPAPVPPAGGDAGVTPAAGAMRPVGQSPVSGQMEVMAHGEQTMVNVTLNGPADANTTHAGHIHQGSCDNIGAVVAPLQEITLSGGTGMASSMADALPATVMDGQHVVSYHQGAGDNPGPPVVCGQIPAQAGATTT